MNDNDIIWYFLIAFFLCIVFGIIPTYACCSHNDHLNHENYLRLEEQSNQNV
jgi:hypothetical protein